MVPCSGELSTMYCRYHFQGRIQDFRRRGRQPFSGGRQHMIMPNISEKLHEIEKILGRRGAAPLHPPMILYPPVLITFL